MNIEFGTGFLAGNDLQHTVKMSKIAEELGFSTCWIAEDYFYGGAFSTATACAIYTSKIKIGIGVINPYTRHPVLSTMELGALDAIAEGRTILGLGASNKRWIEEQMGIVYQKPLSAIKEASEIIRELLKNTVIEYNGTHFHTGKIKLGFKPYRSHVPLYIGAKGPKALQTVGRVADGVLSSIMTSEPYIHYIKENLAIGTNIAGRDLEDVKIAAYLVISISEDRKKARDLVKPIIAESLGIHGDHPILIKAGMNKDKALAFREALISGHSATHLVTDWMIDTFAVAGTPSECREKLNALIDAGVDYPVAFEIPGIPVEETMKQVSKYLF